MFTVCLLSPFFHFHLAFTFHIILLLRAASFWLGNEALGICHNLSPASFLAPSTSVTV